MLDFFQFALTSFWSFFGVMLLIAAFSAGLGNIIEKVGSEIVEIIEIARR